MELKTIYFENPGSENTEATFRIARQRADELDIRSILVASSTGDTAIKAMNAFQGLTVIVVSSVYGSHGPNTTKLTEENRNIVEDKGGTILITTHAFSGVSRAMRDKFHTHVIGDIIADTLRVFGQGIKVVCEIALMAADSGLVRTDENIISIGGSNKGADTAVVMKPVNTNNFFDLKIREILCKPHF
jgi:hypothetical protein